jgi:mono/diheme cytochrome c family protein
VRLLRPTGWRRLLVWGAVGAFGLFVLIQAVPYGRNHSNPPVTMEPKWDAPQTRALAARACFDCHSNRTKWRWYSKVAPASWLVQRDVDGGRAAFNFSEWDRPQDVGADDVAEAVRGGSMPPWFYTILHSNAKLSAAEKDALIRGLNATLAASPPKGGGG